MTTNAKNYHLNSESADDDQNARRRRLGEILVENMEEWNKTHNEDEQYFVGSDNPFADAGLPNPEDYLMQAKMLRVIEGEIERRGLSRGQAASLLGVSRFQIRLLGEARLSKIPRQTLGMMVARLETDEAKELVNYMKEWNKSHSKEERYFISSDHIVAENGLAGSEGINAQKELLKSIVREVKLRDLPRWRIALLLGISWFKVRHLLELQISKFSLKDLFAMAARLEMADMTLTLKTSDMTSAPQPAKSDRWQLMLIAPQFA